MKLYEEFKLYESMWDEPSENTTSNYVFIDLSGSSYAFKDELTAAVIADGHKGDNITYFDDFSFVEATRAAEQGHNVFLYTKDDDYKFNSELEKFPNVKVKIIPNLDESAESAPLVEAEDPYGYGPYKTFSDATLKIGDYVLAQRPFSSDKQTYPARVTSVTRDWIEYTISGFGFTDKGTKARHGSKTASTVSNARKYLNK